MCRRGRTSRSQRDTEPEESDGKRAIQEPFLPQRVSGLSSQQGSLLHTEIPHVLITGKSRDNSSYTASRTTTGDIALVNHYAVGSSSRDECKAIRSRGHSGRSIEGDVGEEVAEDSEEKRKVSMPMSALMIMTGFKNPAHIHPHAMSQSFPGSRQLSQSDAVGGEEAPRSNVPDEPAKSIELSVLKPHNSCQQGTYCKV